MIVKYCDRCNKKIDGNPFSNMEQCKLPLYSLSALYIGCLTSKKDIDLCDSCQRELKDIIDKWMESEG